MKCLKKESKKKPPFLIPPERREGHKVDCFRGRRCEETIAMTHQTSSPSHFRFYASSMGRFLKPDNIIPDLTNPQNWNAYTYVKGNPVNFNDPSGHEPLGNSGHISIDYVPGSGETTVITDEQPKWVVMFSWLLDNVDFSEATKWLLENDVKPDDRQSDNANNLSALIMAQDEALMGALAGGEYAEKNGVTFCNQATYSIVKAMKADETPFKYSDSGNVAVANDVYRYLSNEKTRGKWKPVDESEVQGLADQGKLVVGVSRNPGRHGHLVTARLSIAANKEYAAKLVVKRGKEKYIVGFKSGGEGPWIANIGRGNPFIGRAERNKFKWYTPVD